MPIRWRLAELIEERGTSAYRVALDAGLTPSAVYKLLKKGNLRHVDVDTLEALGRALKVDPFELLEYTKFKPR